MIRSKGWIRCRWLLPAYVLILFAAPAEAGFSILPAAKPPAFRALDTTEKAEIANFDYALKRRKLSKPAIEAGLTRIDLLYAQSYGPTHPETASRYADEAAIFDTIGDRKRAAALLDKAVMLARSDYRPNALFRYRDQQADRLLANHHPRAAEKLMRQALIEILAAPKQEPLVVADAHVAIATALAARRRFSQADAELRIAFGIRKADVGDTSARSIELQKMIAANYRAWGKFAEADAADAKAAELSDVALSQYVYKVADIAKAALALANQPGQREAARAKMQYALNLARMKRRNIGEGRDKRFHFSAGTNALSLARSSVGRDEEGWMSSIFERALDMFAQFSADDPAQRQALADDAFRAAQDMAVSPATIAALQTMARAGAANDALAGLIRDKQDMQARALDLDDRYYHAQAFDHYAPAVRDLGAAATEAAEQLSVLDDRIRAAFPAYFELTSPHAIDIGQVQKLLADDEAVLMLVPAGSHIYQFGLSRRGFAWHRLDNGLADAERRIGLLGCQLDPLGCPNQPASGARTPYEAKGYARYDLTTAYTLYRDLVAPVEPAFESATRLYVMATGSLGGLSLPTLITAPPSPGDDAEPHRLETALWLADHYALTSIVSIEALTAPRARSNLPGRTAFRGYGAPTLFGGPATARGLTRIRISRSVGAGGQLVTDPQSLRSLQALPGTRVELKAMAEALGAPENSLRLGDAATEAAVRSDPGIGTARIVAFATHGVLPGELMGTDEPGLILTPPLTASPEDDGFLSASEVAEMRLDADWLILSACNTATADGTPGSDSLSSLARSFLYAGAGALLASHWRISDVVTAALTVETLRIRGEGDSGSVTRARALQQAMHAVRTGRRADGSAVKGWTDDWAHPSAWAPFAIIANHDD